jgi:hypothetical protein
MNWEKMRNSGTQLLATSAATMTAAYVAVTTDNQTQRGVAIATAGMFVPAVANNLYNLVSSFRETPAQQQVAAQQRAVAEIV